MDVLPDSPPPTFRGVYLTVATMVGFLGILLLAGYSFAVYQADSLASLGFLFPLAIFGVAAMVVCGLMLFGANSDNTWGFNVAAIVSIFVIPALFLLVVGPLAERHCMLRHMEEMEQRIPLLNEMVALVDASEEQLGHIPTGEAEFIDIVFNDQFNEDHWDKLGSCDWRMYYEKIASEHYCLRYEAIDALYCYDSRTPERGWYSISEKER